MLRQRGSLVRVVLAIFSISLTEAVRYEGNENEGGYRAPPPAILTHKQAVTNDGVFNYVFAADNGLKQGESISPDGTRTGAYQYIDPSGKTISVKYVAGKDGFRIIEGDHIPPQPQPVKPISEFQPPEYRERLEAGNNKYKTPVKNYVEEDQEEPIRYRQPQQFQQEAPRRDHQRQQPQQYLQEAPRRDHQRQQPETNQQYKPQANLFRPAEGAQQKAYKQHQPPPRSMLYSVEQRHDVNYRRYLDNGQAADGGAEGERQPAEAPYKFDGGYNFEIKG